MSRKTICEDSVVRMPVMRLRVVCGLRRHDGNFLTEDLVEQGRLADVGPADDSDVAASETALRIFLVL